MGFPRFSTLILLCAALAVPAGIFADVTSGADFLKIPRSARAIALGESYTAVIDDPTAIDYNPAALNTIRNVAASMMYQTWIDNTYGLYLAGAYRLSEFVIGGSVYWFNYGGFNSYDLSGNQIAQYNPNDLNVKVAASLDAGLFLDLLQGMSIGAAVSMVNRNLLDTSLFGFTLDTGINYKTTIGKLFNIQDDFWRLRIGALPLVGGFAVQNIGFAADSLTPVRFSAGLSFGVLPDLILSMDLTKDVFNTPWIFKMGAEYSFFEILSLRAGFNAGGTDTSRVSLGLGLRYPMLFNTIRFDYAFTPIGPKGILGNNHNFSLFGEFKFDVRAEDYYVKGVYYFSKKEYLNTRDMWKKALALESRNELYRQRLDMIEDIVKVLELETNDTKAEKQANNLDSLIVKDLYGEKYRTTASSNRVVFFFRSINLLIQSVAVMGDFNGWETNGVPMTRVESGWSLTLNMKPGRRQYKFIIDKVNVITDPGNPDFVPDGIGGNNSVITVQDPDISVTNQKKKTTAVLTNTNSAGPLDPSNETNLLFPTNTASPSTNRQDKPESEQKVIYTNLNIQSTNLPNAPLTNAVQKPVETTITIVITNKTTVKVKPKPKPALKKRTTIKKP